MNSALAENGYVIVRGFLEPGEIAALQGLAARAYAAVDAGQGPEFLVNNARTQGGLCLAYLGKVGCGDFDIADLIERRALPLIGSCRLIPELSLFRRVKRKTRVGWHIDADGANTKGYDPCINVWVPLVAVGKKLPSIEIISGSHRIMRSVPLRPQSAGRSRVWVKRNFAFAHHEIPQLELGDALLFDHYAMHRTQPMRRVNGARVSGEFRVTLHPLIICPPGVDHRK